MAQEVDFKQQPPVGNGDFGQGQADLEAKIFEQKPPAPLTEQQLMATRSVIQVAMARERAVIAMAQAKIAQMEVDYCELELQFRSQPPA